MNGSDWGGDICLTGGILASDSLRSNMSLDTAAAGEAWPPHSTLAERITVIGDSCNRRRNAASLSGVSSFTGDTIFWAAVLAAAGLPATVPALPGRPAILPPAEVDGPAMRDLSRNMSARRLISASALDCWA